AVGTGRRDHDRDVLRAPPVCEQAERVFLHHGAVPLALSVVLSVLAMTPFQKAEAVVLTSAAPRVFTGAAGITFADQEGGSVRALRNAPPHRPARSYTSVTDARAAGRATRAALRSAGIEVAFAPVLDAADGPLGSRQFARPEYAVAFAQGLGNAACVKHF